MLSSAGSQEHRRRDAFRTAGQALVWCRAKFVPGALPARLQSWWRAVRCARQQSAPGEASRRKPESGYNTCTARARLVRACATAVHRRRRSEHTSLILLILSHRTSHRKTIHTTATTERCRRTQVCQGQMAKTKHGLTHIYIATEAIKNIQDSRNNKYSHSNSTFTGYI